jgi:hypothetical protein
VKIYGYECVDVHLHAFLTSVLDRGGLSTSRLCRFASRERRSPPYPLDKREGGFQIRPGHGGED